MFQTFIEEISRTELSPRDFCKNDFNFMNCTSLVLSTLQRVTTKSMNATWKELSSFVHA